MVPSGDASAPIAKANQTNSFAALADKAVGDPDFAVRTTAASGFAVSFAAADQCTVSGTTVHLAGVGSRPSLLRAVAAADGVGMEHHAFATTASVKRLAGSETRSG